MFQKKKLTPQMMMTLGALMILLVAAGATLAQDSGSRGMGKGLRGERGEFKMERLAKRLDLSEDQQTAIKAIHESAKTEGVELRKELMRLRNEMKGEMLKDSPSEKTVLQLNDQIGELKTTLKANRLKTKLSVREELTPEQRDKMLLMQEKGGHKKGKMGRRGSCGKGGNQGDCDRECDSKGPKGRQQKSCK